MNIKNKSDSKMVRPRGRILKNILSSTYLSAVHVTAFKTTYFIERVYSKLRQSLL